MRTAGVTIGITTSLLKTAAEDDIQRACGRFYCQSARGRRSYVTGHLNNQPAAGAAARTSWLLQLAATRTLN